MDLLNIPLPELRTTIDIAPSTFFDRCEMIAATKGWKVDRRRDYSGPGYDQLNLYLGNGQGAYPMLRMVVVPQSPRQVRLDVVDSWRTSPLDCDEYVTVARAGFAQLLGDYRAKYGRRYRVTSNKQPKAVDIATVAPGQIAYANEKLGNLPRSLAIGRGDARERLINAYWVFHVIRPEDLPSPLREHLAWVYAQVTKRKARHRLEGSVESTVRQMKNMTAARVLERLIDIASALEVLDERCRDAAL